MNVVELFERGPGAERRATQAVRALAVATAVLLLGAVAGLATHEPVPTGDAEALTQVTAAASRTAEAATARYTVQLGFAIAGRANPAAMVSGEGVYDVAARRGTIRATMGAFGALDFVVDGATQYIRVPEAARRAGTIRTPWVSIDTAAAGEQAAALGTSVTAPGGGDPMAVLSELRAEGAVKRVEKAGRDQVRGVPTSRYRAVLDPARLAGKIPNPYGQLGSVASVEVEDPVWELWVGDDGLVRRQVGTVVTRFGSGGGSASIEATLTIETFDFGAPVTVAVPPSAEVTRLGSAAQLLQLLRPGG